MTPEEVSQLNRYNFTPYERVGDDNAGWVNSATPLNADNLNKGDVALFNLLNESNGYVYQLIDKLNKEISARLTDSTNLSSAISSEAETREEADTALENDIFNELTIQVNILNETINNVNEAQSANYKNLTNIVDSKDKELTEKYKQVDSDVKTESERAKKAEASIQSSIPTSVSQLNNDVGYVTEYQFSENYVTKEELKDKNYVESNIFDQQAVKITDDLIFYCGSSTINTFE